MILLAVAVAFVAVVVAVAFVVMRQAVDGVDPAPLELGEPRESVRATIERRSGV